MTKIINLQRRSRIVPVLVDPCQQAHMGIACEQTDFRQEQAAHMTSVEAPRTGELLEGQRVNPLRQNYPKGGQKQGEKQLYGYQCRLRFGCLNSPQERIPLVGYRVCAFVVFKAFWQLDASGAQKRQPPKKCLFILKIGKMEQKLMIIIGIKLFNHIHYMISFTNNNTIVNTY